MSKTLADLKKGETGIISNSASLDLPMKLIEMGCVPGNQVTIVQHSLFQDPIYINVNDSYLAIRKDVALQIQLEGGEDHV